MIFVYFEVLMTMSFGDAFVDRFLGCLVVGQVNEENVQSGVYLWGVDVVAHYSLY